MLISFLNVLEKFGINYYNGWILLSFSMCFLIHHVISPNIFGKFKYYRLLRKGKQMEWDSRIVSTLHALVVSILSIYALYTEKEMWSNRIEYFSSIGCTAMSITVGYFLCDMISMPMYWRGKSLIIFLIHHGFSALAFFYAASIRKSIFYCILRLTSELSTPFTNQRWIFLTSGLTHGHKRVAFTTLVFAVTFSIFRNFIILPYWYMVYYDYGSKAHLKMRVKSYYVFDFVWLGCAVILDILNIYWARGVYRSGRKALTTVHSNLSLSSMNLMRRNYPAASVNSELDIEYVDEETTLEIEKTNLIQDNGILIKRRTNVD